MKTARAAVSDGEGSFRIAEIRVGDPGPGEVLVRVVAAGVCHTDWDSMSWGRPLVMGHEGAGVVEAVGEGVRDLSPGARVLLNWAIPCGRCFQCRRGNETLCEDHPEVPRERTLLGDAPIERSFRLGTMSDRTVVARAAVVPMDADIEIAFASAAIVGCGVMTGVGSVLNAARVEPGSSVAVLGTGGVGLNVVQGARIAGAATIVAVDANPKRLEMAREFGATHCVLADRADAGLLQAARRVRELTGGRGADYAFECTAIPELAAAPLAMVRNAGVAVQVSGVERDVTIDMNLFEWDKVYINPLYGKCRPEIDFPRLFGFHARGLLKLDELVTRTYPLEELGRAFEDMQSGANAKGVLLLGDGTERG